LVPGRSDPDAITLFKSVGTALEDLAAAELAVEGAMNQSGSRNPP
jgi:ornithine cyclodeaminase/alanine dehydrogenase-like protein (mu-crystallin family)